MPFALRTWGGKASGKCFLHGQRKPEQSYKIAFFIHHRRDERGGKFLKRACRGFKRTSI